MNRWRKRSLEESSLLKLSRTKILNYLPKSLGKEREKRKMRGFKGEAPEGILCLFTRVRAILLGISEPR